MGAGVVVLLILSNILFGSLYEFTGGIMMLISALILIFFMGKNKKKNIRLTAGLVFSIMLTLFYLLSSIWAVDSGMAFLGVLKVAWLIPVLILFQMLDQEEKDKALNALPWIGCVMVLAGGIAFFIPAVKDYFYSAGRFGGLFNYANTQAIFLLLCIIWMCDRKELAIKDYVRYVVLLSGIALTGSRTVMVLTIAALIYLMIRNRKLPFIAITLGLGLLAVALVLITGGGDALGRITQMSLGESTFVGRILYAEDALPLVLKHPFGMGYLGYYYVQNSVQTGWYSVMYVHNDLLQLVLDIGIIPAIGYLLLLVLTLVDKSVSITRKVMIIALFLHGLMDFDLSFGSVLLLMCLLMEGTVIRKIETIELEKAIVVGFSGVIAVVGFYFTIPTLAQFAGNDKVANAFYPAYTEAKINLLSESEDAEEVDALADQIIKQNKYSALANYGKAMVCDVKGDYKGMIKYGKKAIELDYFNIDEYENYVILLYDGLVSGDDEAAQLCAQEVFSLQDYMDDAMSKLSQRGKMIKDQPELELTDTMVQIIEALQEE